MNDDPVNRSQDDSAAAPRRWYQLRLRTIFVGMVVVGCMLVAYRAYIEPYRQQRQTMALIKELGGTYQSTAAETWQRWLFGSDYQNLTVVNLADCDKVDEYLPHVMRLPRLETLVVGGEAFTEEQLQRWDGPESLRALVFDSTSASPEEVNRWWTDRVHQRGNLRTPATYHTDRRVVGELAKIGVTVAQWAGPNASRELERQFGPKFFDRVLFVSIAGTVDDNVVARLNRLCSLLGVHLTNAQAGDADVFHLAKLARAKRNEDRPRFHLALEGTQVSDAGLAHLAGFTAVDHLDLSRTKVTDAGLRHLASLPELHFLWLDGTSVTDAGLEELKGMKQLMYVRMNDTKVTAAGIQRLGDALPTCSIHGVVHLYRSNKQ